MREDGCARGPQGVGDARGIRELDNGCAGCKVGVLVGVLGTLSETIAEIVTPGSGLPFEVATRL